MIHTRARLKFATIFLDSIFSFFQCKLLYNSVLSFISSKSFGQGNVLNSNLFISVMEQLDLNRKNVEAALKDHLKLCRWERPDNHLLSEPIKRTRQKVKKLIQDFSVSNW